jgi:hypothetical protein
MRGTTGLNQPPAMRHTMRAAGSPARMICLLALIVLFPAASFAQKSPHGKIGIVCADCHTTTSWKMSADAKFDHASTGFTLAGQHKFLECRSCHAGLRFEGTKKECLTCHTDVHNGELGLECIRCHTLSSWVVADMRQKHQETRFPLVGRHLSAECESCHNDATPRRYASTSPECVSCHREDYAATLEPSHAVEGFTIECATCHKVTSAVWKGSFDHNLTAFPLTGAHKALICSECHVGNTFGKLPTECVSCHDDDYRAVLSPNHLSGGFSTACLSCHTTVAWKPATFDHNATRFALTGKHVTTPCEDCHVNGNYQLTYTDCYQCHQPDYAGALNPNHAAGAFDHNCSTCHTTTAWQPASFDHNKTRFALTGKHTTTPCADCHVNDNYQLTYTDCYQCHQPDYAGALNPNHVAGAYDHNCATCHTTAGWSPASFNHNTTRFALTGKHTATPCADCHTNGNYQLTYTDCYQCHQPDYVAVTDPNHVVPNFGHDCTPCHTTTAWLPSTFNHDGQYFRIYSGRHNGQWPSCATCHDAPADYKVFTCISCHEHNQADTDGHHGGVRNYIYSRTSCYTCHRNV